jgi:hypothetical protein
MASNIYPIWKQNLMAGTANNDLDNNTTTDGPHCALIDTGVYTYSAAHDFQNDLSGVVGTNQRIVNPTVLNGIFDGDDLTYTAVTGASVEVLVIYRNTAGGTATSPVVAYIELAAPVTPNGGNIIVQWNATGIFLL